MRLRVPILLLIVISLGLGPLVGCGGPMPAPPQQDHTPTTADRSADQDAEPRQAEQPSESASDDEQSETASRESPDPFAVAKEIIRLQSCGSCHTIQAQGLNVTGQVGPDLTNEGDRGRTDDWLRRQLIDPASIPDDEVVDGFEGMQATMPSYGRRLGDEGIRQLVAFLQSLSSSDDAQADHATQPDESRSDSSQAETAQSPRTSDDPMALAKQVIREHSCGSCHTLRAQGLNLTGQVGPDLTQQGARGRTDEWLRRQLTDPSSVPDSEVVDGFEGTQSTMPSYERQLSQADLDALIAFLQSLDASDD